MPAFSLADKYFTMNKTNIDQALAALADALKSSEPTSFLENPKEFIKKIPLRSLSGDHINGGKVHNFSSLGITDRATKEQIDIDNERVSIKTLEVDLFSKGFSANGTINSENIVSKSIKADVIEAEKIVGEITFEKNSPIVFSGDSVENKGLLWSGKGYTKQFVFLSNSDRFFSSENIDLARGRHLSINNIKLLDEKELGTTVTKSNLQEVGRLKGLIVDGGMSVNQYLFYDQINDRLGLGTDQPRATISICENDLEILIGSLGTNRGNIGTYNSAGLDLITDNTARISIEPNGNIILGNKNSLPIVVTVQGTLAIGVNVPDSRAHLHVSGPIKFNNKLHMSAPTPPISGSYDVGDIIWNSEPQQRKYVGWVCIKAGSPGIWCDFGEIR